MSSDTDAETLDGTTGDLFGDLKLAITDVTTSGSFAAWGSLPNAAAELIIDGLGALSVPVPAAQAAALVAIAEVRMVRFATQRGSWNAAIAAIQRLASDCELHWISVASERRLSGSVASTASRANDLPPGSSRGASTWRSRRW